MISNRLIFVFFLLFLVLPESAFSVHNEIGKTRCLDCHVTLPFNPERLSFYEDIAGVCRECHNNDHAVSALSHPVEIVPSMKIPLDMPLDRRGKLTCITCHTFHAGWQALVDDNPYLLRRPQSKKFCYYCHNKL